MRKAIALVLCALFLAVIFSDYSVAFDARTLKGQELYARSNLKAKGSIVYFHNMSALKTTIPYGTAVAITGATKRRIRFYTIESGKKYTLLEDSALYGKYFVKKLNDIGIDGINAKTKEDIENMKAVPGMTKKEVFVSKGCPAYIAFGEKSSKKTFDQIMESDSWYYNTNSRGREVIVNFKDSRVSDIIGKNRGQDKKRKK